MNLNNMLWCFFVNVSICFYHFHSCSTYEYLYANHSLMFYMNVSIWMFCWLKFRLPWDFWVAWCRLMSLDVAWDGPGQDHADAEKHSCSAQLESKGTADSDDSDHLGSSEVLSRSVLAKLGQVPWCSMCPDFTINNTQSLSHQDRCYNVVDGW